MYAHLCPELFVKTKKLIQMSRVIHPWNHQPFVAVRLMRFCTAVRRKPPLGCPQVSPHVFQQVEQPSDEFACLGICDAVQVKVFEHSAAGSSRETLRVLRAIMPAFPPCDNPLRHGLSASDF